MTRPTEPPAAGLGVRVDRPGQDRRLLPRRDLPNGPKALWTSHVRRSPPRRFDDTSRDRAPPNQRYAPRPRSPDNDSDSLSLAPSSDGSDDEYGPSTGLARRKHQSENEVASAAALAAAHAAWAALSDSEDEEVREDTAPTRAVEASPETVARFNARDRTVSPAPAVQIRARARTMSPPRYADTRRRGSSPPRFSNNRSREDERRLFGDPSPRRESSRGYHDRGGWDRRYSPDTRGGRRRSPSPMRRRDEYRGGGTEEDGTRTGETLTRASATVLPTVLYPTTLTAWTRTTTVWTRRTRHRRVRRRCRCSRQRARRRPWTLAKTQLCHQTQLCSPRPSFRGRTIFSSPGSRPRSLMRSGRRCRT